MDFEATARTPSLATSLAHRADQLSLQRMGGARQRAEDAEAHTGKQVASLPFPYLGVRAEPGMRALPSALPRLSTSADPPPACSVQTHKIYTTLKTMAPDLELWLDVKQPFSTGDLEKYVKQSDAFLLFLTDGYFSSEFCRQELAAALAAKKKIIIIRETVYTHGGGDRVNVESLKKEICTQREKMNGQKRMEMDETKQQEKDAQLKAMDTVVDLVEQGKFYPWTRRGSFQDHVLTSVVEDIVQHMVVLHMKERGCSHRSDELAKPFLRFKSKLKLDPKLWLHVPQAYPEDVSKQLQHAFASVDGVQVTSERKLRTGAVPDGSKANPVPVLLLCDWPNDKETFFDNEELVDELKRCFPKSRVDELKRGVEKQMPEILLYDMENSFAKYFKQYLASYEKADAKLRELERAPLSRIWSEWPQDSELQKVAAEDEARKIFAILLAQQRWSSLSLMSKYLPRVPSAAVAPAASDSERHSCVDWQR